MAIVRKKINDLLAVKQYDGEELWINNKVLDGLSCEFMAGQQSLEKWSMNIANFKAANTSPQKKYVCLEGDSIQCWIEDGFNFLGNLTGIFLSESQHFMMSMLLPKIPQALKDIFQYKTVSFSPIPEDAYGLSVQYGTGDVQQSAVIWMKKVQWISVLSNQKFTSHVQPQLLPSFKFQSQVVLGYLSLGYVECSELEPGDLLFFEDSYFSLNGKGRIKIGNINFDVNLEKSNNQYQVVVNSWSKDMVDQDEYLSEREEVISEDMAVSLDGAEKNGEGRKALQVPVSDIPVKLSVKLGTIEFTVADLGKMLEGKVYPIDSMCPGKVQLMANGMELARGQLVEVDGKLAVEVQRRWIQP